MNVQEYMDKQREKEWEALRDKLRNVLGGMNTVLCASKVRHNYNDAEAAHCLHEIMPRLLDLKESVRGESLRDRFDTAFDGKMAKRFDEIFKPKTEEKSE